jgi:hypothetical protein
MYIAVARLLRTCQRNGAIGRIKLDPFGYMEHTVMVLSSMRRNFAHAPELILADCTYKTNVYQRPLMVVSGVDEENKTYIVAIGLLENETMPSYKWLFKELRSALGPDLCDRVKVFRTDGEVSFNTVAKEYFPKSAHHRYLSVSSFHCRAAPELTQLLIGLDAPGTSIKMLQPT